MAIEFHCPECGNLARSAEAMAGRLGPCPKCGARIRIPESEGEAIDEDDLLAGVLGGSEDADSEPPSAKTIEFTCPGCRQLVRTPAAAAGKKGKCPNCTAVVRIPKQSQKSESATGASSSGKAARPASAAQPETVEFPCPDCSHAVRTPRSMAGKKGKCPGCGGIVVIPRASQPLTPIPKPRREGDQIVFSCEACRNQVRTPFSVAGKKGKCPQCGEVMNIPKVGGARVSASSSRPKQQKRTAATEGSKLVFDCPACGEVVRTPASAAGKKGKCPHCDSVMQIPRKSQAASAREATESPIPTSGGKEVVFDCPSCREQVRTPGHTAGKKGKCPHCDSIFQIPGGKSQSAAESS